MTEEEEEESGFVFVDKVKAKWASVEDLGFKEDLDSPTSDPELLEKKRSLKARWKAKYAEKQKTQQSKWKEWLGVHEHRMVRSLFDSIRFKTLVRQGVPVDSRASVWLSSLRIDSYLGTFPGKYCTLT
jgi:hypothetical protein